MPQPLPHPFEDREKLVATLSEHRATWWNFYELIRISIKKKYGELSVEAVVKASVGGNTFRAFHHCNCPSLVFRDWAAQAFKQNLEKYRSAKTQKEFDNWLGGMVDSLRKVWHRKLHQDLAFGPSLKLPNLVAKHLCISEEIDEQDGKRIAGFLHVPLDRYSIVALRNRTSDVSPAAWNAPRKATMGFINKPELYWAFQYRIRQLASEAKVPPIVFDFVCWNSTHSNDDVGKAGGGVKSK